MVHHQNHMHMVGHDYKFIHDHMRKMHRNVLHALIGNPTYIIQHHFPILNVTKKMFHMIGTNGDKKPSKPIIIFMQSV